MFVLYNRLQAENIDPTRVEQWRQELPVAKQAQIDQLTRQADQIRSLAGYQLLKTGMALLKQTDFKLAQLEFTARGLPRYPGPIGFSLSHTGGLVVCGLLSGGEVGIDTEQHHEIPRSLSQYLTKEELSRVRQTPATFFDIWTRKEAVVKAGSDEGLAALTEVVLQGPNLAQFRGRTWHIRSVSIQPGYTTHVATDRPTDINLMVIPLS
jgi:4'-phosphopantetheinyl transferase